MATLTLTRTWINLFTGEGVSAYRATDDPDTVEVRGQVVTYAGGRMRAVTSEGSPGSWSLPLVMVPSATTVTLRAWMGQAVQVRDNRGRKQFGVILSVPRSPWRESLDTYNVPLTLLTISVVEGV
jgi:hypothetical protein